MLSITRTLLHRSLAVRTFSSSCRPSKSFESPTYPNLFYHSIPGSASYALSFLPTPAPSLDFSPTTIGVLSDRTPGRPRAQPPYDESADPAPIPELLPRNFEENEDFVTLLHDVLAQLVTTDMGIGTLAMIRKSGYLHVADERNPADPNRVPDPSDIIASILIQESKVLPGAYEISKTHRLVTMQGMMKLNESLMVELVKQLEKVREVEIEMHA